MRISDLLRKVADFVDQKDAAEAPQAELSPVPVDNTDNTDTATMISPLQQKHELLKKVSGVDNNTEKFDDFATDDGSCDYAADPEDELQALKSMAGLTGSCSKNTVEEINPKKNAALAAHFIADDHESD
jgi:hypothetical protein